MKNVDYILIGQGIAGTSLAQQLYARGKTFIVVDSPHRNQSSRIAAGVYNPLVLKRMKLVYEAKSCMAYLPQFYREAENLFQESFVRNIQVHRIFFDAEEANTWIEISDQPHYAPFIDPSIKHLNNKHLKTPYGLGKVSASGRINTTKWLDAARIFFIKNNALLPEKFDFDAVTLSTDSVHYKQITAKNIVFCEGMLGAHQNPYFNYLPFSLTKGELLIIESAELAINTIVQAGVFILPLGDNMYKVGATYNWKDQTDATTESGRNELLNKLSKICEAPFTVKKHVAGIRPTVRDRRPLLGTHKTHKNVHIFNGLGSRGILLAPYLSKKLSDFLIDHKPLPTWTTIDRFRV